MGKTVAAAAACAAVAFVAAFFAVGADKTPKRRTVTYLVRAPFADPGARAVAAAYTGRPDALRLPAVRHVTRHARKPSPIRVIVQTVPANTTTTTTHTTPAPPPPPVKHKRHSGGTGTGTTVVGP